MFEKNILVYGEKIHEKCCTWVCFLQVGMLRILFDRPLEIKCRFF